MNEATSFLVPCAAWVMVATSSVGCAGTQTGPDDSGGTTQGLEAAAIVEPKGGSTMTGSAAFTVDAGKVTLSFEVGGAPPGEHAVHIHEHANCESHDAESAGGHWNPTSNPHGKWGVAPGAQRLRMSAGRLTGALRQSESRTVVASRKSVGFTPVGGAPSCRTPRVAPKARRSVILESASSSKRARKSVKSSNRGW